MPIAALLPLLALSSPAAPPASARIVRVAMFTNGYAFVARRVAFAGRVATVRDSPDAALGTLLVLADDPQGIERVETVVDPEAGGAPDLPNYGQLLLRNVGRRARIALARPVTRYGEPTAGAAIETVEGRISGVIGDLVYLETAKGGRILPLTGVQEVGSTDPAFRTSGERRVLRIVKRRAGGAATLVALERGLTWSPSYALQTTPEDADGTGRLTLVARASVANALADLKDVRARVVAGLPSLPYRDLQDPLANSLSAEAWLQLVAPRPGGYGSDPYRYTGSPYGGGFGGGGGMGGGGPAATEGVDLTRANVAPAGAQNVAELVYYDLPALTLARGDRLARDLFRFDGRYARRFVWTVPAGYDPDTEAERREEARQREGYRSYSGRDPFPPLRPEVVRALVFTNTGTRPLFRGPVALFDGGEYSAGATMPYVARGEELELGVDAAPELVPARSEEEISRERVKESYPPRDTVTIRGTLRLTNRRDEPSRVRVRADLPGELLAADGNPRTVRRPGAVGGLNGRIEAIWDAALAPGETLVLTYTHRQLVSARG